MADFDRFGVSIFAGLVVSGLIIAAVPHVHCDTACFDRLAGDTGWASVFINLGTLVAVVVGGRLAWRSYKMNEQADVATRFEKAATLIADANNDAARVAGLALLEQAANAAPAAYAIPTLRTISHYLSQGDDQRALKVFTRGAPEIDWRSSSASTAEALTTLVRLVRRHRPSDPDFVVDGGRAPINGVYLADKQFNGEDFSGLAFSRLAMNGVEFRDCSFERTTMAARVGYDVVLIGANLTNAFLTIQFAFGEAVRPNHLGVFRILAPKGTDGCLINNMTYEAWAAAAQPAQPQPEAD